MDLRVWNKDVVRARFGLDLEIKSIYYLKGWRRSLIYSINNQSSFDKATFSRAGCICCIFSNTSQRSNASMSISKVEFHQVSTLYLHIFAESLCQAWMHWGLYATHKMISRSFIITLVVALLLPSIFFRLLASSKSFFASLQLLDFSPESISLQIKLRT